MYLLLLTTFAILHYSHAINPNKTCSSCNDPHMVNFANLPFEFHQKGEFCMYNSGLVEVKAGFSECSPGSSVTCNCLLRIKILTGVHIGKFLVIDTCSSGTWSVQTSTGIAVTCPNLSATPGQLFLDAWWSGQPSTSVFPGFRCTKTASGATAIRTDFNSGSDVLVLGFPGWPVLSCIEVYGSNNYFTTTQYSRDRCLCGKYQESTDDGCRNALQDKCLTAIIGENKELDQLFEKLIQDCKLDFSFFPDRKDVGLFQKDFFEAKKMELLIKIFNKNVDLIKQRGFNAETSAAIEKYCACKGLVPNKNCIVKGECKPFQICI